MKRQDQRGCKDRIRGVVDTGSEGLKRQDQRGCRDRVRGVVKTGLEEL